jgi:Na+-translocating ferredoxin:NAD+ oxidoreductase RnfG subunit
VAVSEYFDYFILYNSSKQVEFVKITAYKATRGHQMASAGWLRQYKKYDGSKPLLVGKDIDAISGATVSVKAINEDIMRVTKQLLNIN